MQISTRSHDYLVDTLELRGDLQCLNTVFTDPNIVKVSLSIRSSQTETLSKFKTGPLQGFT
ncbi:hypothetical protein DPMN_126680 [Dreissena polymorpha]|uniref:3'-5' exonuclease domain-containing protein n=1 Tax=Dreissena polymorpha TaxID=45954 RepID=A0A9D4JY60_DREPO|nr:hypothetical protein DPMN_126680 [Dreissena polymorpha]